MYSLNPNNYLKVKSLVYEKSGISLGDNRQSLVEARLQKRIAELKLKDFSEYLKYLNTDRTGQELVKLLDEISTNYTFFYREAEHFSIMNQWLKSHIDKNSPNKIRIWCAASSTGEEPYTLAMEACERVENKFIDTKLLATDISTKVLNIANSGKYSRDKMSAVPKDKLQKYWSFNSAKNEYEAGDLLKKTVSFSRLNLMEAPYPMKGPFDIIFCRNVMIYFDESGRSKIITEMLRLLPVGGLLFLGHSESIQKKMIELKSIAPSVYQRVL